MKIETVGAPRPVEGVISNKQAAARERAIKILQQGQQPAQTTPVQNPSKVAPEEMSAITSTSAQSHNNEVVTSETPQTTPSEVTQAETKAKPEQPLSSQYAQLARKEKAIRAKMQQFKAQEDALKAREAALAAKEAEMQGNYIPKSKLAEDPLSVLSENGVDYNSLTERLLASPQTAEQIELNRTITELRNEIKALKDAQEGTKKTFEQSQQQQYQQAINQIRTETKQLVTRDDNFETIRATNSVDDVVELIEKTFQKEGVLLSVEEAAQAVEDYLVEEASKLMNLKKIQSRLKPSTPKEEPKVAAQPTQTKQARPTLSNSVTSQKKMSARERAIAAFEGKLNKS